MKNKFLTVLFSLSIFLTGCGMDKAYVNGVEITPQNPLIQTINIEPNRKLVQISQDHGLVFILTREMDASDKVLEYRYKVYNYPTDTVFLIKETK